MERVTHCASVNLLRHGRVSGAMFPSIPLDFDVEADGAVLPPTPLDFHVQAVVSAALPSIPLDPHVKADGPAWLADGVWAASVRLHIRLKFRAVRASETEHNWGFVFARVFRFRPQHYAPEVRNRIAHQEVRTNSARRRSEPGSQGPNQDYAPRSENQDGTPDV